jgi:hypothetical protein
VSGGKGAASAAPDPTTNDLLEAALQFAELDVRVVAVRGKNPGLLLGGGWQHKATTDESVLRGWWHRWPDANIGIVPGIELAPIDVDAPVSFERLQVETVKAPITPRYITGGGAGRERLLFAHPGNAALAGITDTMIAPGVQLRVPLPGRGALMSTVPPSVHPDTGVTQEWRIGLDETPLARLPGEWLARVRREPGRRGRPKSEWAAMFTRTFTAGCGETHPSFVSMAGRLVPAVGAQATAELLRCWNRVHCQPPKPEREIIDAVAWVARQELGR